MKLLRIAVPLIALLVAVFIVAPGLADEPTTTTITWSGSGGIGVNVDSGDSNAGFSTAGAIITGSYTAVDKNDNPYTYGVDSFTSYFNGSVTNGIIDTGCARVNSYTPMYGSGGQISGCIVSTDGTASVAYRSTTNYAKLVDATYGYQLPGGHNVVITDASGYTINRYIQDNLGNSGQFYANGDGSATLDCMSAESSGCWNLVFGRGAGCYTDANFSGTGTNGYISVAGIGNNSVTFNGMGVSAGGGQLSLIVNWLNSVSISDYSLTAH